MSVCVAVCLLRLVTTRSYLVIVLYCGRVPAANAPWMHCSRRLIVQTLVFSRSYLHRQVSPPETLVVKGGTTGARNGRWILPENARLPRNIQGSFLHAVNLRHGTNGFTSLPKEGVLRIFFALKNPTASAGFEPANVCTRGQHANSRPPKPISCLVSCTLRPFFSPIIVQYDWEGEILFGLGTNSISFLVSILR